MAIQNDISTLQGHFYERYAKGILNLIPEGHVILKEVDFNSAVKNGNFYHQPVTLGFENGKL